MVDGGEHWNSFDAHSNNHTPGNYRLVPHRPVGVIIVTSHPMQANTNQPLFEIDQATIYQLPMAQYTCSPADQPHGRHSNCIAVPFFHILRTSTLTLVGSCQYDATLAKTLDRHIVLFLQSLRSFRCRNILYTLYINRDSKRPR